MAKIDDLIAVISNNEITLEEKIKVITEFGIEDINSLGGHFGYTALYSACLNRRDAFALATTLLSPPCKANINQANEDGSTPLHAAVLTSNQELLQILLSKNPDLGLPDNYGHTPFFFAISLADLDMVKKMAAHSPDLINKTNKDGLTPIRMAASLRSPSLSLITFLLENNAVLDQELLDLVNGEEYINKTIAAAINKKVAERFNPTRASWIQVSTHVNRVPGDASVTGLSEDGGEASAGADDAVASEPSGAVSAASGTSARTTEELTH